jgi:hypothetical protein
MKLFSYEIYSLIGSNLNYFYFFGELLLVEEES